MSDTQQAAGWWQASDGRWYPPADAAAGAVATPPAYGHHPGTRRVGKTRSPWGTWGLSIITFGIYYFVWWYKVNEETKGYDPSIDVKPGMALLALFVPIANIVTIVKTGGRIGQVERASGSHGPCSGGLGFLFAILFATHIVYYQKHLNEVWAKHGSPPEGSPV